MTARRTRGSGSLRKYKDGRWGIRYRDETGRQVGGPIFANKTDANLWSADRQSRQARGNWIDPRRSEVTLAEFGSRWLATKSYTPKSRQEAERIWAVHVNPFVGKWPLGNITPELIREWYSALSTRTGPAVLRNSHNLLKSMLATAVDDGLIADNPVRIKGANRQTAKKRPLMTRKHAELISSSIAPHLTALVLTTWWTSMRLGEVLALRWQDIDFDTDCVHVHRQVVHVGGVLRETAPKAHSDRYVDLDATAMEVLRAHKAATGKVLPSARVFTARDGGPLTPHAVNQAWGRARAKAGLPQFRFHDLRHGSATLAAQSGATTYEVMHRLGHRSMNAALLYQHAAKERGPQIAAAMAAYDENRRGSAEGQSAP